MAEEHLEDEGKGTSGGLWGGRFQEGMAPAMEPLNRSLDVDGRLWREDVRGSLAWADALHGAGVLSGEEHAALREGLERVRARLEEAGVPTDVSDEDIHTLVERLLGEEVGELAGKLHTGRSRNDQVATDLRLWAMSACDRLTEGVTQAASGLVDLATRGREIVIPGYTHLQQGQPVRAAHWALSHVWPLLRDRERLRRARDAAGTLPLGSGALAGCPFPVDREALREALGFLRVSENSMDAVSDRDWAVELTFTGALLGVHLSRLCEDLLLFSTKEFSFLRLGEGYSTGSSLMPQKRNPDAPELIRGKSGRLVGNLTGLLTLLKGLPTGYNRDLQEEKSLVFDTVDTLELVLPAIAGAVRSVELRPDRIREALDAELLATDVADLLVSAGVPFRRSHEIVGGLVREAEERGVPLHELPEAVFRQAHPALSEGVAEVFDWERSVESRDVPGGTSMRAVEAQLAEARARLEKGA